MGSSLTSLSLSRRSQMGSRSRTRDMPYLCCADKARFRSASEDVALRDLLSARSHDVENRLWVAHSRANATFRKQLSKVRPSSDDLPWWCSNTRQLRRETPNKPVETRKFIKLYLEFLKDSQRFYRNYIQRLNATYGAIPELEQIAQQASNGRELLPQNVCAT